MASHLEFTTFYNVINNELISTTQVRHGINPANKQQNPPVPVANEADLDRAVNGARAAFMKWSKTPLEERRKAVAAYGDAIEANKDAFARLLTREQGKPISQANVEVGLAATWAKEIPKLELPKNVLEHTAERKIIQRYTPMGVAGAIVPWNFPVLLAVGKIVPALYTGNAVILKPSPFTPYCALKLAELATRFFPPGLVQCLSGTDDLGPMLTLHPGIDKISFTGSTVTGQKVMINCAKTMKRVTLELGGNDPAIICDDVDIDAVVPKVGILSFLCSGQICMMIKRIYVHEKIYDEFLDKLVHYVKALPMGEGTQPDVFFGPIQNAMQYEKTKDLFGSVAKEGLKAVLGGTIEESNGYFVTPSIIGDPPENSRVVVEEPFAPIIPVCKWSDEDDVIARANDSKMGLGSSVWTKDMERAERIADNLESGSVWINSHFDVAPYAPFGGHKHSGIGTEWGVNGLIQYCNSQTVWYKLG